LRGTLKKIGGIEFGLMSPKDIRKMSVAQIVTPDTYNEDGYPIENGLMDPRLGAYAAGPAAQGDGSARDTSGA